MMDYPSEHLVFSEIRNIGKKLPVYEVYSKFNNALLGEVQWYGAWRQYVFAPTQIVSTIWSHDCLTDLSSFIQLLMRQWKEAYEAKTQVNKVHKVHKTREMACSRSLITHD